MLQLRNRASFFYVERGALTVVDSCLVLTDSDDRVQYQVPCQALATILVGPGTSVTTEAIRLAAEYGTLIQWVGEHGVRCYSAGRPWSDNTEWLDKQVDCYSNKKRRLTVAREMFRRRFGTEMSRRSLDQLRGLEGARVKAFYRSEAERVGIPWEGRRYVRGNPLGRTDAPNLALNVLNTCLYGVVEAAVNATGMSPALGFIHHGSRLSFVLDIADLYKTTIAIPLAFEMVATHGRDAEPWPGLESDLRIAARDRFRDEGLLGRVVTDAQEVVLAGANA